MDISCHKLQTDCSNNKSLASNTSIKYALVNVISTENKSTATLRSEEKEPLSGKSSINNGIDSNITISSSSIEPSCSNIDSGIIPVDSEQPFNVKVTKSDQKLYDRILDKLYIAYQNLCPVIDEIISNAAECTASNKQTPDSEGTVCSITHEQYIGAIKASRLIQEIHNDVVENAAIDMELLAGEIHLPAADLILDPQQLVYPKLEDPDPGTAPSRIYIEKRVVGQLIELYHLLQGALQQLFQITKHKHIPVNNKNKVFSKNYSSVFKLSHTSKNQFKVTKSSNFYNSENNLLLSKLQEEYQGLSDAVDMLKSIVKETSGSIGNIKKLRKTLQAARKTKSVNSVTEAEKSNKITDASGARRCILECLVELAEVRKYLKNLDTTKETDVVSQVCLTAELKRECCSKKSIPHLHAKLNGIPIVVKLNQVPT